MTKKPEETAAGKAERLESEFYETLWIMAAAQDHSAAMRRAAAKKLAEAIDARILAKHIP